MPATVATYQTMSWDLDNAYDAINDLVNKFQPGMLNLLEQQLVGPNGGQPLSFQKDIFGPLGDRITLISDFKKPIKEDSQRMLLAHRPRGRQGVPEHAQPALRDSPGRTQEARVPGHHDLRLRLSTCPIAPTAATRSAQGPISIAIAKDTFFVTTDTTLLEQVLRPGNATLADKPAYPDRRQGDSRRESAA